MARSLHRNSTGPIAEALYKKLYSSLIVFMFQIYLKIAWRNLMRNGIYSLTNIGGLAVGLTAFLMTLLYETHLAHYDAWDPGFKNVYQIRLKEPEREESRQFLSPKMLPLLNLQVPGFEKSTRVSFYNGGTLLRIGENKFYEKR